jgi:glycosyltransferase involved in cell wall biosynthesis
MRKILIFNSSSLIYGAEKGLINLIKALKDNFKITVVLPNKGPLETELKKLYPEIEIKKFPLAILTYSLSPFYLMKFFFLIILNILYFTFYVKINHIEVICSNNILLLFPAFVSKFTNKKHIWYIREFFTYDLINLSLGKFIEKFSQTIICQSKFIKNKLFPNLNSNKIHIIYEPLDINNKVFNYYKAREELNLSINSVIISVISRLHPLKGQYEFIRNIKGILKEKNNLSNYKTFGTKLYVV